MYTIQNSILEFLNYCRFEKYLSSKTIKSYKIDLQQFVDFLNFKSYTLEINTITKDELREYIRSVSSLKAKSIKRKIATVKAMFNYLEFEDKIAANPFRKLRIRIKEPKVLPVVMDLKDIRKIFNSAYVENSLEIKNVNSYAFYETLRNIVVIELLFATGARVSEISGLSENNIDIKTGLITIKGKGDKERLIQVCNPESIKILNDYYKLVNNRKKNSGGYFLLNRMGKQLSEQSIRAIVKKLSRIAKLKKQITPHTFRHTFATLLLEKDVDIKYIQSLLGHSSILTTQIYTHVTREKQKKILRSKHPRKDFKMLANFVP